MSNTRRVAQRTAGEAKRCRQCRRAAGSRRVHRASTRRQRRAHRRPPTTAAPRRAAAVSASRSTRASRLDTDSSRSASPGPESPDPASAPGLARASRSGRCFCAHARATDRLCCVARQRQRDASARNDDARGRRQSVAVVEQRRLVSTHSAGASPSPSLVVHSHLSLASLLLCDSAAATSRSKRLDDRRRQSADDAAHDGAPRRCIPIARHNYFAATRRTYRRRPRRRRRSPHKRVS